MEKDEVRKLAELRNYLIGYYQSLESPENSTSLTSTQEVAYLCETVIKSMDDLLREFVKFE
tara:strand:- start:243 stop:425 length:183 start_codon:yes stop_codon:yes gene_type:complete